MVSWRATNTGKSGEKVGASVSSVFLTHSQLGEKDTK